MVNKPKVTAFVLFYNHENFVRECLDSVFGQTYQNMEVWIMDDASNDGTVDTIKEYLEINKFTIKHKYLLEVNTRNIGLVAQVNKLFERVDQLGDLVALFAGDDISNCSRIEFQVNSFNDKNVVMCTTELVRGNFAKKSFKSEVVHPKGNSVYNEQTLLKTPNFHLNAPSRMFCSSFFKENPIIGNIEEDQAMFIRAILMGKLIHLHTKLVFYRKHNDSIVAKRTVENVIDSNKIFLDSLDFVNKKNKPKQIKESIKARIVLNQYYQWNKYFGKKKIGIIIFSRNLNLRIKIKYLFKYFKQFYFINKESYNKQ